MMPRLPSSPYMMVTVSTKTYSAREPDHRASMKPMEIRSGRPVAKTLCSSGFTTWSMDDWESTTPAALRMSVSTSWMVPALR